ncbi:MAG TPA: sigma 54-interacting transcriptional regulator [Longimicrobium sp.]|jgi:transcriptional regulator with GAF, ATPase, and Fis domain|uniref:sigma 54-interacting transcriptional regulator n=1 Tax=Longimicrobium sp. TaxID=2029185 RepID=UPI002ED98F30
MSLSKVWHHVFAGEASRSRCRELLAAMAAGGLSLAPLDPDETGGCGVVLFDQVSDELCDFVRETSQAGRARVLALGTSGSAVANGQGWRLLRAGASDVFAREVAAEAARAALARFERWAAVDRLVDSPLVRNHLVGRSPVWLGLLRQVVEAAAFTDVPVLVTGESGTGKELVARLIHALDTRPRKRELVLLDCTTVVPQLSGSEFFGHERGAYTGAVGPREGAFALADGGTLFLDEVGELPPTLQAQLLRVVQEKTYKRTGGNAWQKTDFRLVCATNRDLVDEVARGAFRADLYYRIASVTCRLPALRDRPEDIIPLFEHFLAELRPGAQPAQLDEPVREFLLARAYPGNVRDLRQLAARVACRCVGDGPVTMGQLPEDERPAPDGSADDWRDTGFETCIRRALVQGVGLKEISRIATDAAIRIAVLEEEGNLQRAARRLGVTDRALQMRKAAGRSGVPAAN